MVAAHESLTVLTWMGQAADLDLFERLALGPRTPADVAQEAAYVVGNTRSRRRAGGTSARPPSPTASGGGDRRRVERSDADGSASTDAMSTDSVDATDRLRGLVYVLGMRGRYDLLREVRDALPDRQVAGGPTDDLASGIVQWWLDLPSHLRPLASPSARP